ncbi:MAG: argininosuccinate lyase [Anaerovoracaceae bacterium]
MANLWSGRFEKEMDEIVEKFNASITFDRRLYKCDIKGSVAHAHMLAECGIITEQECGDIVRGLEKIRDRIERGEFEFSTKQEDIHMAVEAALIEELGETGKKLHTARSRNDQVQTDMRLYIKEEIGEIREKLIYLEEVLLAKAEEHCSDIFIGFTHLQHAQPVTIGFWLMAYFQMFRRDVGRLDDCLERMDQCPLGSCALAGTTMPIDRQMTASELGFAKPTENAMDSVSDRDYLIELLSAAAISSMHISRFAEECVIWNTSEFGYMDIDDSFCTGSSIMPQKKNPDMAELLRGKTGRVYGSLVALMTVMKGTPLAYNKDFQEDKEGVFDAIDTWKDSLLILAKMIEKTGFRSDRIAEQLSRGFLNATDIAEHLAKQGIPFREAHRIVGNMVKTCEQCGCDFEDLTDAQLKEIDLRIDASMLGDISMEACVAARVSHGGTAPSEVERQIGEGRKWLDAAGREKPEVAK